jgi:Leucine-rich repeat (LRR) protein
MNFRFSNFLRKIPDVSSIPNLNELDLCYCKNLVKVHHSIGSHDKLVGLNLEGCINLRSFPKSLKMRSLKFLNLNSCKRLKKFPEIKCQMECLEDITFCGAGIKELPSSIGCLVGVKTFGLNSYTNLMTLSDNSHKLRHLDEVYDGLLKGRRNRDGQQDMITDEQRLVLNNCSKVDEFLKTVLDTTQSMPGVVSIEESTISSVAELIQLPFSTITSDSNDDCSSIVFPKPRSLYFSYWALSGSNLFRIIDCCSTLTKLSISKSDIVTIPPCIRRFVRLKYLELYECKQLRKILGIPPNLISLKATGCVSLAIFLEEARRSPLFNTPDALFQVRTIFPALTLGNHVLTKSEFLIQRDCPSSLRYLDLSRSAIVILPTWLNTFVGLNDLNLQGCNRLEEIPELPPNIEEVNASECTSLERFQFNNMKDLPYLHQIDFSNCHGLRENMGDDLQIRFLSEVSLFHIYTCYLYVLSLKSCLIYKYLCNRDILRTGVNLAVYFQEIRFQITSIIVKSFQIPISVK